MSYQILPNGEAWANGVFCIPKSVMKKIKFLDSVKLSVLTLALGCDGEIDAKAISASLKTDYDEVKEALDFWVNEGILTDGIELAQTVQDEIEEKKPQLEKLPMPSLSPKDIVAISRENSDIAELLRGAQEILKSALSLSMQSNIVNMVTYYGLTVPVVLTLLHYYNSERSKGKSFTIHKLMQMAKDWADEEINTLEKASNKLQEIEDINDLWATVIEKCEFEYRKPTSAQQKMLVRWKNDFSMEMITFAINTMKKYNEKDKQSLKEVDNILKDWKRKGCSTPDEVKAYKKPETKANKNKLQSAPSFDINKIANDAMMNDDFDI